MNEALTQAIEKLEQLQFETGGTLLEHIVALERELLIESQRRVQVLREAGLTDAQIGESAVCTAAGSWRHNHMPPVAVAARRSA